jgi:hypothetical protein
LLGSGATGRDGDQVSLNAAIGNLVTIRRDPRYPAFVKKVNFPACT